MKVTSLELLHLPVLRETFTNGALKLCSTVQCSGSSSNSSFERLEEDSWSNVCATKTDLLRDEHGLTNTLLFLQKIRDLSNSTLTDFRPDLHGHHNTLLFRNGNIRDLLTGLLRKEGINDHFLGKNIAKMHNRYPLKLLVSYIVAVVPNTRSILRAYFPSKPSLLNEKLLFT